MSSDILLVAAVIGALATAAAVIVGVWSLRSTLRRSDMIAQIAFEDSLTREYRTLIAGLPVEAFHVDGAAELTDEIRRVFYWYVDLCNEQFYLGRLGRIRPDTQTQWKDGIKGNITKLPTFHEAWMEIGRRVPGDFFEDLHELDGDRAIKSLGLGCEGWWARFFLELELTRLG